MSQSSQGGQLHRAFPFSMSSLMVIIHKTSYEKLVTKYLGDFHSKKRPLLWQNNPSCRKVNLSPWTVYSNHFIFLNLLTGQISSSFTWLERIARGKHPRSSNPFVSYEEKCLKYRSVHYPPK